MNSRFFEFVEGTLKSEDKKVVSAVEQLNRYLDEHSDHIRKIVEYKCVYDSKGKQHIICEIEIQ